jgi:mRNA interferase RelE/StbE
MEVKFTKVFLKEIERNTNARLALSVEKIINQVKSFGSLSEIHGIKKLSNHPNAYRIRTGDYRVGILTENNVIIFSRFMHRKDIYKFFP